MLGQISSLYYIKSHIVEEKNNYQPVILHNELMELNHTECKIPMVIPLMSSKEKFKCQKVEQYVEQYISVKQNADQLLYAFYAFRHEGYLKPPPFSGT